MNKTLRIVLPLLAIVLVAAALVVFWPSGGANAPPPIAYGTTTCAECRMVLSRPGYGAQVRAADGSWKAFDDVGCLVKALAHETAPPQAIVVEVQDGPATIPAEDAFFVKGGRVESPMHQIVAFASEAKAKELASTKSATVLRFDALRAMKIDAVAAFTDGEAMAGRAIYEQNCSACHGERGDGNGPAAAFLSPKPRDFTKKAFKLRTTESGKPPRPEDVLATIERGMPGSSMPAFDDLSDDETRKVGAYVFRLSGFLGKPSPDPIPDPGPAPELTAERVARGKELFAQVGCTACHGPEGRGDGPNALTMKDIKGEPIKPRDLQTAPMRGGDAPEDIYYRIFAGIDGTPMPAFADLVASQDDRWALVSFVRSIRKPETPPLPTETIAAGRAIADKYGCRGCHTLDDGKGGSTGPDFRLTAQKVRPEWIEGFLQDPRAQGKIYPWRAHRMPGVDLPEAEAAAMATYITSLSKRPREAAPDPATFPADKLATGKGTFMLRCAQCHALGETVKTPLASQQGPDLARVSERLDYGFVKPWILDPKKFDPKTKMTVPGVTPDEAEAVRMFIWKISEEERAKQPAVN